jgi:hypothetical protein
MPPCRRPNASFVHSYGPLRERPAEIDHQQYARRHEDPRQNDEPEDPLSAVRRDRAERVQPDEGADAEEHHVEAPKGFDQLLLLVQCERRGLLGNR